MGNQRVANGFYIIGAEVEQLRSWLARSRVDLKCVQYVASERELLQASYFTRVQLAPMSMNSGFNSLKSGPSSGGNQMNGTEGVRSQVLNGVVVQEDMRELVEYCLRLLDVEEIAGK